jgi:predicted nucleotidyltransferase
MDAPRLTDAFRNRLVAKLRALLPSVLGIYVYGSVARGDARPDSDLDLAVLLPEDQSIPPDVALEMATFDDYPVDFVDLREVGAFLQREILYRGEQIFRADDLNVPLAECDILRVALWHVESVQPYLEDILRTGRVLRP